jgi:hypothetical protein
MATQQQQQQVSTGGVRGVVCLCGWCVCRGGGVGEARVGAARGRERGVEWALMVACQQCLGRREGLPPGQGPSFPPPPGEALGDAAAAAAAGKHGGRGELTLGLLSGGGC